MLRHVSNPRVKSVPLMSLSIVPGIPTTFIPCSLERASAPRYDPSPPITTIPSISLFLRLFAAIALNLGSLNSRHLAVYRIVPPVWIINEFHLCLLFQIQNDRP